MVEKWRKTILNFKKNMVNKYTTKTSSIKATAADIRNLNVENLSSSSLGTHTFNAEEATLKTLHSTSVEISDSAKINTLEVTGDINGSSITLSGKIIAPMGEFTDITTNTISAASASLTNLSSSSVTASAKISAPSAELTNVTSTSVSATSKITAPNAELTDITSSSLSASNKITAPSAELTNITSEKVTTDELTADAITVGGSDLSELINAAAVDIGDKVQDDRYLNIGNLVFKGSYVNVVKDPNSSKITLWINKSTAFPGLAVLPLSGAPSSTGSAKLYSDTTDNFAIPVTSGSEFSQITQIVKDGTGFNAISMSIRNTDGMLTFTSDKTNSFWARTVYNGVEGTWIEVPFYINAGTFDIDKIYETSESVSPFSGSKSSKTDGSGTTVNYFVRYFDDNDAEYGRVPGQAEVEIEISLATDTILTKDGGMVRFDYAISATNPESTDSFSSVNMFFTEYKKPSLTFTSAEYTTKASSAAVSGLKYNTNGSTAKVVVSNIIDTQWKASNKDDKRLTFNGAGTETNIKINETGLSVSGGNSAAVYAFNGNIALGTGGAGSATITATPVGYISGDAQSKTLSEYWGSIPTSSVLVEKFGNESYRMKTPTSTPGSYPSGEDVTTHKITGINNTNAEHCSAVCQYNKLYHPANSATDATGKQYSRTESRPAVFIRTFTGTANNKFKLVGDNLIQKNLVQIWWKDGNNWYDLSTPVAGSVEHSNTSTADTITKIILPEAGETKRGDMTIAIVLQPGATPIGQINASFSA